jgi:hypothetical protein
MDRSASQCNRWPGNPDWEEPNHERHDHPGSILFTRTGGAALGVGTYTVTDGDGGADDVRALVTTGSATHPTGVFRGQSGELVITSVTESTSTGTFRVSASGFLAASPELEDRPVTATGWFRASQD